MHTGGVSSGPRGDEKSPLGAPPRSRIEVARGRGMVLFKVTGLGSVNNAGLVWDFAEQAFGEGCYRFAFDLARCRGLDSTFLGMLVGIAQEAEELSGREESPRGGWVCVVNASASGRELFDIVGADKFVRFSDSVPLQTNLGAIEMVPLLGGPEPLEKRLSLVRRAHENLIEIDSRNEARFGEFLRCLAAELERRE